MYGIINFLHSYTYNIFIFILFKHKILLKDIFKLINKIIFWEIFTSCPIYHAIHIDQVNENIFKLATLMVNGNEIIIYEFQNVFPLYLMFT